MSMAACPAVRSTSFAWCRYDPSRGPGDLAGWFSTSAPLTDIAGSYKEVSALLLPGRDATKISHTSRRKGNGKRNLTDDGGGSP
jgi:hypothetical protein